MQMLYVIVNSIINSNGFSEIAKSFIIKNAYVLDDNYLINLLKTVFFDYTDRMVDYLKNYEFEDAYIQYIKNNNY